jgi:Kef-type K+ transport system membrane component KefB
MRRKSSSTTSYFFSRIELSLGTIRPSCRDAGAHVAFEGGNLRSGPRLPHFELVIRLFLQLTVILAVCRLVGMIGRRFGQTQVVSEMVAGVLLGPSLFGLLMPGWQQWLFPTTAVIQVGEATTTIPHPSMAILFALSQIGLVLYMFIVGLEFDTALLRTRKRSAAYISGAGIIVPFVLGGILAVSLLQRGDLFAPGIGPLSAAVYLGAAMSITAFPMLARILYERGISRTPIGTTALAAGSIDDAIAWCLLAIVLATVRAAPFIAIMAVFGGVIYVLLMVYGVRPQLWRFEKSVTAKGDIPVQTMTFVLMIVMVCAFVTDVIGIYAVFGAFVAGAVMPKGRFNELLQEKLGPLTTSLLLPIFFVFSGLNTQITLVDTWALWGLVAVVVLIAILGKGVACTLAAKISGAGWRESVAIGTLMNARGLMELIILNIGLERGLITPTLFTIMVIMAIVTTLMASPLFQWVWRGEGGEGRVA